MTSTSETVPGQCRCGQVRLQVATRPVATFACHCTGCQRMTASAFSLSALYPADGFRVTAGDPVLGGLRGSLPHFFCPSCLSWLYTRPPGLEGYVNVRATMLDDASSFRPFIETWTSEKLPWASTPAVHSFAKFPQPQEFARLLGEFAEFDAQR